jgi:hypothetical protein
MKSTPTRSILPFHPPSEPPANAETNLLRQHGVARTLTTGQTWGQEFPEEFHVDFREDIEIQDKGSVTFGIVFKEGPMKLMKVTDALKDCSATILKLVELMEKFLKLQAGC